MIIICKLFGHKWQYDFPSMPCNRRCYRCKTKEHLDVNKSYETIYSPQIWNQVEWDNREKYIHNKKKNNGIK